MADTGIRRRLDAIIVLQVIVVLLLLPGGSGLALALGVFLALKLSIWAVVSVLQRTPQSD